MGTLYKKEGHDVAVARGLSIVEAKGWERLLEGVPSLCEGDEVLVYCFRGGARQRTRASRRRVPRMTACRARSRVCRSRCRHIRAAGMRSGGMAHLLSRAPLSVATLAGGYKRFRNWAIDSWSAERDVVIVGGPTGSGKTDVLHQLRGTLGQQVSRSRTGTNASHSSRSCRRCHASPAG